MHPYVFVPLAASLVGTAIAAANVARAPHHEATAVSGWMLSFASLWGLLDFMTVTSADADTAVVWVRLIVVPVLVIGALSPRLLGVLAPARSDELKRVSNGALLASVPSMLIGLCTPWLVAGVVASPLTVWRLEAGPLFPWMLLQAIALPTYTVLGVVLSRDRTGRAGLRASDGLLGLAVGVPLVAALVTEGILPMLGIDFPRVGVLAVAVLGGAIWLYYFSGFDGAMSEAGLARRILECLPTGVALMETDGRLRAVNAPLARWMGVGREELIGHSISSLVLMPLPELLSLEDERESELLPPGRDPIPVAIGIARIHDRQGGAVGFVVSLRDLREQAELKSHLDMARQMATVGEMAAGIAHEVNNPVAYIQANLNLMRRHYADLSSLLEREGVDVVSTPEFIASGADRVDEALEGLARISSIVREVRGFAHAGQGERQLADVNELLESALHLAALNGSGYDHVERAFSELPRIEIGAQELKQALFGVAQWALAHVAAAGRIEVSTALVEDDVHVVFELRTAHAAPLGESAGRAASGGIQLVIARQIIEEGGGELHVEEFDDGFTRVRVLLTCASSLPIEEEAVRPGSGAEAAP
jgi:signal transduction histidine kinase